MTETKKIYLEPTVDIVELKATDVITTSGGNNDSDIGEWDTEL